MADLVAGQVQVQVQGGMAPSTSTSAPGAPTSPAPPAPTGAVGVPGAVVPGAVTAAAARPGSATVFTREPAAAPATGSRVVQRLVAQNASLYAPRLARVPLPPRAEGTPRPAPRKPAAAMSEPRNLNAGASPLAPAPLANAHRSVLALGTSVDLSGESHVTATASDSAAQLPSRHGLVAYTATPRGDRAYITTDRWQHIVDNHFESEQLEGLLSGQETRNGRVTTLWPTRHALAGPSMDEQQVLGVIVDAIRSGQLRNEVRDTLMSEYDVPREQAAAYGVSEVKVSMSRDGLVLSSYPAAGSNVLAVRELTEAEQQELIRVQASAYGQARAVDDEAGARGAASTGTTFG